MSAVETQQAGLDLERGAGILIESFKARVVTIVRI